MFEYLDRLLHERGLTAHGYCLVWDPALVWTHVISDAVIGLSYFSIPIALATFLMRRRDIEFGFIVWMFAAFIMACGTTHFLSIWTLWHPDYGIEALVKLFTAVVSVVTAIALWPLLVKALALPSPAQLRLVNEELVARIGERDAAMAALERETAEREHTEALLRQSQKMEAVGQLTGGIAHDFNNLLTVVIANLDRAGRAETPADRREKSIHNAMAGAERAAKLTDQLLSFSRRQPLQSRVQDLNEIVLAVREMLERTLGSGIRLMLDLSPDLPPVTVDRNQTENAILNLAINARDAMPDGGTLSIRTFLDEVTIEGEQRRAVALAIGDSGRGMPPEVREHVFEPFFTTKPLGEGTGLGLSQVYGFAKQSNGDVSIDSVEGEGTTVTLHLPCASL